MANLHRKAAKALRESARVLTRKQGRGHHDGNLLALHGGDESSTQGDLGLAEPDISANQPVHGPAGSKLAQNDVDGGLLVLGFLVGKAGAEFVIGTRLDG